MNEIQVWHEICSKMPIKIILKYLNNDVKILKGKIKLTLIIKHADEWYRRFKIVKN